MKSKIILEREGFLSRQTLGTIKILKFDKIWIPAFKCYSLELPYVDNAPFISCIPIGTYQIVRRWSPRHGRHLHILGVPGREWILIHSGNFYWQLAGCILPGIKRGYIDSDSYVDVLDSKKALDNILELLPKETTIEIRNI
jgi:hypothetical protein